jgi:hypothetical protein
VSDNRELVGVARFIAIETGSLCFGGDIPKEATNKKAILRELAHFEVTSHQSESVTRCDATRLLPIYRLRNVTYWPSAPRHEGETRID